MRVRKLRKEDAPLMLEWMHDDSVVHDLKADFASMTLEDCERFIEESEAADANLHLAVADECDQYMGTVSLKHINHQHKTAEFAITVRSCAMGKGYSQYAMEEILKIGLRQLGLRAIFWCVSMKNTRALRFYDKNQYQRIKQVPEHMYSNYSDEERQHYIWYRVCDDMD